MSARDLLVRARAIIATPETWTQGAMAKGPNGGSLSSELDPSAVSWCALGAVLRAFDGARCGQGDLLAVDALGRSLPSPLGADTQWDRIENFNDAITTTHADVLALFDRAIEAQS